MTYLLDTNIVVFMARGLKVRANPNVRQRERHRMAGRILDRAPKQKAAGHEVALSAITVAELELGPGTAVIIKPN
jgi:predicted nucleic acid-binding protein